MVMSTAEKVQNLFTVYNDQNLGHSVVSMYHDQGHDDSGTSGPYHNDSYDDTPG